MAEHLLDAAEVGPALEQVRRERMAEEVGVDPLGIEAGLGGESAHDQERAGAGERAALGVEEDLRAVAAVEVRPSTREVAAQGFHRLGAQRHDALLVAFADAADEAGVEIDAAALQAHRLAHAQAAPVEKLDQRPVAEAAWRRPVG